jgi:hypothetical protein
VRHKCTRKPFLAPHLGLLALYSVPKDETGEGVGKARAEHAAYESGHN